MPGRYQEVKYFQHKGMKPERNWTASLVKPNHPLNKWQRIKYGLNRLHDNHNRKENKTSSKGNENPSIKESANKSDSLKEIRHIITPRANYEPN